jgi:hypothetical protein
MLPAILRRNKEQQDRVPGQFKKRAAVVRVYMKWLEKMASATVPADQVAGFLRRTTNATAWR